MNLTRGQLAGAIIRYNLAARGTGKHALVQPGNAADVEGRSLFPHMVREPDRNELLLKPGGNQKKLGRRVTKGPWKGAFIYSLTLEERATCPRNCVNWFRCFGNNMGLAVRYRQGPALEQWLWRDLNVLRHRHRKTGFAVRLHLLGDFYSVEYVDLWRRALASFPGLRVFGYTANQVGTPVGDAIHALRTTHWSRFAIRTSGAPENSVPRTVVVQHGEEPPPDVIVCPEQTNTNPHKPIRCGSCALCWAPAAREKTIAFQEH